MAKHNLRYLSGSLELGLWYPKHADNVVDIYADASYASDPDNRRSVSGWVFLYGRAPIAWSSRLQKTVATSTCEKAGLPIYHTATLLTIVACRLQNGIRKEEKRTNKSVLLRKTW